MTVIFRIIKQILIFLKGQIKLEASKLEQIILTGILNDSDYARKVLPYVQSKFFTSQDSVVVSELIMKCNSEYNAIPTKDVLYVELDQKKNLDSKTFDDTKVLIEKLYQDKTVQAIKALDQQWLLDKTESHFKQQSCYAAVLNSLSILEGDNKKLTPEAIPGILEDALNIQFDTQLGHDYFADAETRFDYYHNVENKIPFHLDMLNKCTNGGAADKSLIVPVAPTGVGKSFFMTAWTSVLIKNGIDVLYVTLEMAEEKIAERLDAALFDMTLNSLSDIPKDTYLSKIDKIKASTSGNVIIKEESSGSFNALKLKALLDELKSKEGFVPKVVMVDYLNLANSYRIQKGQDTYLAIKYIAEELRAVASEYGMIVCAPTQTNREGVGAADYNMTQISESMGIAHTADFILGLIETDELRNNNQMRIKLLKNRWGALGDASFVISVNKSKMQMYDFDDITSLVDAATKNQNDNQFSQKMAKIPSNKDKGLIF